MTTWMLVEDDPDLYDMLHDMIEIIGHQVLGFTSGEAAAAWVQSVNEPEASDDLPELALIDVRLPGKVHGPELSAQLRQHPVLSSMAIVLMTAYRLSVQQESELIARAEPDMMLYKPLPPLPEFRRKLEDLLM
ncbi:MAG: hypothetical protein CL610_25525 [Anaerolineaceae bacterium]|nr:hypothetical protein [Anaerolineaceae bacterium]